MHLQPASMNAICLKKEVDREEREVNIELIVQSTGLELSGYGFESCLGQLHVCRCSFTVCLFLLCIFLLNLSCILEPATTHTCKST